MKFIIVIIIVILTILTWTYYGNNVEGFNDHYGTLCGDCSNKTFGECKTCFNCIWCVDKWGNGKCIGGDNVSGPYNKEKCARIYTNDPFYRAKENNDNYNCRQFGPPNQNRIIGVNYDNKVNAV
jgi:hypothetical protein